ncbi:hypothetical protein CA13_40770 [Planctomycetes bacterium CA13]|uniref:Transposase IS4-like domain-containing protein n=2 Tax=Novipirellula herctigrandis TaxID=2527986 RepID=A0A5C5Z5U2_9BACT|nr:hypothetical protein CA13_40770 [Planctomycetes bacterium CA13]
MHRQKATFKSIIAANADSVLTVKGNQGKLAKGMLELYVEYGEANYLIEGLRHHATVEKSHSRKERRDDYTIAVPDEPLFSEWEGIKSIGMVYRNRGGVAEHDETTFFLSSLPPKVKQRSRRIRDHWRIENSEHSVLDVTSLEDASRIRIGNSPDISAAFRRMALNILHKDTTVKDNVRGKRLRAGWDDTVLDQIYSRFDGL